MNEGPFAPPAPLVSMTPTGVQDAERGTYRMRVYGRADSLLYEAYYPSLSSFRYERQGDGLVGVVAIQIDWLEWTP